MTDCVSENLVRCRTLARLIAELQYLPGGTTANLQSALEYLKTERDAAYRDLGREVAS